jgi:hypothetical protein
LSHADQTSQGIPMLNSAAVPPLNAILAKGYVVELRPTSTGELVIVAEHCRTGHRERAACRADRYGEIAAILSELEGRC